MVETVRIAGRIADISRAAWDALLEPGAEPFLEWMFLHLLEASGSAVAERGWAPRHVTVWRNGTLVAAAPAWVKTHSFGEFMYNDWVWPRLAARLGAAYFPRLVFMVPMSPATGPRVLVAPGEDRSEMIRFVLRAAQEHARAEGLRGVHALFVRGADLGHFQSAGAAAGAGVQYHWQNHGYRAFDDFLAQLPSRRRTMIRRERARLQGVQVRTLQGAALTPGVMDFAHLCHEATARKYGGESHLTRAFFLGAGERFSHRAEVVLATAEDRPVGAAFNLRGDRRLYGRHWGALEERPFLHFNVCYYHSVERCIAEGFEAFEPGAGGEHKLARGFDPVLVHSAHWFADRRLHAVLATHLRAEVRALAAAVRSWNARAAQAHGGLPREGADSA